MADMVYLPPLLKWKKTKRGSIAAPLDRGTLKLNDVLHLSLEATARAQILATQPASTQP